MSSSADVRAFRKHVWDYWKRNARHTLPWRNLPAGRQGQMDPYRILVSEVMLQQTQVPRVLLKYKEFLKAFPTVRALANASLTDVLRVWSGLGYNRRGKYLHDAAKTILKDHKGNMPKDLAALRKLPGMGPYTASAIRVFAFNEPDILIETNIRAVLIHHFYQGRSLVKDAELLPIAAKAAKGQDPRKWHSALMDYGVYIKKMHKNPARRSSSYVRQSKFEGSLRQIRGAILRELHSGPSTLKKLPFDKKRVQSALISLARDGLIAKKGAEWQIC